MGCVWGVCARFSLEFVWVGLQSKPPTHPPPDQEWGGGEGLKHLAVSLLYSLLYLTIPSRSSGVTAQIPSIHQSNYLCRERERLTLTAPRPEIRYRTVTINPSINLTIQRERERERDCAVDEDFLLCNYCQSINQTTCLEWEGDYSGSEICYRSVTINPSRNLSV